MASSFDDNQNTIPAYASAEANEARIGIADYNSQKEIELNESAQRNLERLRRITKATEFRESTAGQVITAGTANNLPMTLAGGAVRGTGAALSGAGKAFDLEGLTNIGEAVKDTGEDVLGGRNVSLQERIERTTPTGDLFKPSTWDIEDFNLAGFAHLVGQTTAEMAPIIAAASVPYVGLGLAPAVGAAQSFDEAYDSQKDKFNSLTDNDLYDNDDFRNLIIEGYSTDQARRIVSDKAAKSAGTVSAAIGAVGTERLMSILRNGVIAKTAKGELAKGITAKALAKEFGGNIVKGSVIEGVEEVSQTIFGRLAASLATDTEQDLTEDTLADAILGAAAGGAMVAQQAVTKPAKAAAIVTGKVGLAGIRGAGKAADALLSMPLTRSDKKPNPTKEKLKEAFEDNKDSLTNNETAKPKTAKELADMQDPSSENYNPSRIAKEAEKSLRSNTISNDDYKAVLGEANEILDMEINEAKMFAETDPEVIAQQEAKAKSTVEKIDTILETLGDDEASQERRDGFNKLKAAQNRIIEATPETRALAASRLAELTDHKERLRLYESSSDDAVTSLKEIEDSLTELESNIDNVSKADLDKVITRFASAITTDGGKTTKDRNKGYRTRVERLINQAKLSEADREDLRSKYRNLEEQEKLSGRERSTSVAQTRADVIDGDESRGQKGIKQMIADAEEVISNNDQADAQKEIKSTANKIKGVIRGLTARKAAIDEAIQLSRQAKSKPYKVMPIKDSTVAGGIRWEVTPKGNMARAAINRAGGLEVTPSMTTNLSKELGETITEANDLLKEFTKIRTQQSTLANKEAKAKAKAEAEAESAVKPKRNAKQKEKDNRLANRRREDLDDATTPTQQAASTATDEQAKAPFDVTHAADAAYYDSRSDAVRKAWNDATSTTDDEGNFVRLRHDHFEAWYDGGGVSGDVGSQYDAHGIAKGNPLGALLNMLRNGINTSRRFDSAPLTSDTSSGAGIGTADGGAYKDGPFIVLSGRGKDIGDNGIETVLVSDLVASVIPALQQEFPGIRFIPYSQAQSVLSGDKAATPQATTAPEKPKTEREKRSVYDADMKDMYDLLEDDTVTKTGANNKIKASNEARRKAMSEARQKANKDKSSVLTRKSDVDTLLALELAEETGSVDFTSDNLIREYAHIKNDDDERSSILDIPYLVNAYLDGEDIGTFPEKDNNGKPIKVAEVMTLINALNEAIQLHIPDTSKALPWEDFVRYFIQEDGYVEENVLTAMSAAILEVHRIHSNDTLYNTTSDISRYLGIDEDQVTDELQGLLQEGSPRDYIIDSLGATAIKYLGIKFNKDVPLNVPTLLRSALGVHALSAMEDAGLLVRKEIQGLNEIKKEILTGKEELVENKDGEMVRKADTSVYYVSPKIRRGNELVMDTNFGQRVEDLATEAPKSVETIFGKSGIEVEPLTEKPESWNQSNINNSERKVPKSFKGKALKVFQRAWKGRENTTLGSYRNLPQGFRDAIMGIEDTTDMAATGELRATARNNSMRAEEHNILSFLGDVPRPDFEFWLNPAMWSNQRVGWVSNIINPLASKLHRMLVKQADWNANIPLDENNNDNRIFRLFVADSFGLGADTKDPTDVLTALEAKVSTPEFKLAMEVVNASLNAESENDIEFTTTSQEALEAFSAVVKDPASYDALVTYTLYANAKADPNQTIFNTDFSGSVDGVTSGVALATVLLGSTNADNSMEELMNRLERSGFYREGTYKNVAQYKEAGNQDNYQTFMKQLYSNRNIYEANKDPQEALENMELKQRIYETIIYFTGDLINAEEEVTNFGRDIVKTPVMATAFGASTNTMIRSMSDYVLKKVEDKYKEVKNNPAELDTFYDELAKLMGSDADPTVEWSRSDKLTLERTVKGLFIGGASTATNNTFGRFTALRDGVNSIGSISYQTYQAIYMALREQFFNEELSKGRIHTTKDASGKVVPIGDLNASQLKRFETLIKDVIPIAQTPMSLDTENDFEAGLGMSKVGMVRASKTFGKLYSQEVQVLKGDKIKQENYTGNIKDVTDPGVSLFIGQVHSTEAAIMWDIMPNHSVASNHDAVVGSVSSVIPAAKDLNRAAYKRLATYGLAIETLRGFVRTMRGLDALTDKMPSLLETLSNRKADSEGEPTLRDHILRSITSVVGSKELSKVTDKNALLYWYDHMIDQAISSERTKLNALLDVSVVSQYSFEGAEYNVTPTDRNEITKLLSELGSIENELRKSRELVSRMGDVIDLGKKDDVVIKRNKIIEEYSVDEAIVLARDLEVINKDNARNAAMIRQVVKELIRGASLSKAIDTIKLPEDREIIRDQFVTKQPISKLFVDSVSYKFMNTKRTQKLLETIVANKADTAGKKLFTPTMVNYARMILDKINEGKLTNKESIRSVFKDNPSKTISQSEFISMLEKAHIYVQPSMWGRLGTPTNAPDFGLDSYLRKNASKGMPVADALDFIISRVKGSRAVETRVSAVLAKALKAVAPNVSIHYIGRNSQVVPEGLLQHEDNFHAVYHTENGETAIYIKGADYEVSNVNPHIVLHEIIHATLIPKINAVRAKEARGEKLNPQERILKQNMINIRALYGHVSSSLGAERNQYGMLFMEEINGEENPINDRIDEFIAWGMTDPRFQSILAKVEINQDLRNRIGIRENMVSAFKALMVGVSRMLGLGKTTDIADSALVTLMESTLNILDPEVLDGVDSVYEDAVMMAASNMTDAAPDSWATLEVFDALNSNSNPVESNRLKNLLTQVVVKIEGSINAAGLDGDKSIYLNPEDVYFESLMSNKMPFTSSIREVVNLDHQQSYVLEALEASFQNSFDNTSLAYRELLKLYKEASDKVKPSSLVNDVDNATAAEMEQAQQLHSMLFNPSKHENATRYLARFLAASAVVPSLRKALGYDSVNQPTVSKKKGILAKLEALSTKTLDDLSNSFMGYKNSGRTAQARLEQVAYNIANVNGKRRVFKETSSESLTNRAIDSLTTATNVLYRQIAKAGDSLGKSERPVLAIIGKMTSATVEGRLEEFGNGVQKVRNIMFDDVHGFVGATLSEMKGEDNINTAAVQLFKGAKKFERTVEGVIQDTRSFVLEGFENNGANLTESQRVALTKGVMQTGLGSLVGIYSDNQLLEFLSDPKAVQKEITALRTAIMKEQGQKVGSSAIISAADSGYFMATGKVKGTKVFSNAARLVNFLVADFDVNLHEQLESLFSLEALINLDPVIAGNLKEVTEAESSREDDNGVLNLINLHKLFLDSVYSSDVSIMNKGYVMPLSNPNNDVVTVRENEASTYERLGYVRKHSQKPDAFDTNRQNLITLVGEGAGAQRRVSGIINFAKPYYNTLGMTGVNEEVETAVENRVKLSDEAHKKVVNSTKNPIDYKVNVDGRDYAYNGNTYSMDTETKERVYEQNLQMEDVISSMFGSQLIRQNALDQNIQAFEELINLGKSKSFNATDLIELSPDSSKQEVRDAYNILPAHTKEFLRERYQDSPVLVPRELFRTFFGYDSKSLFRDFALRPDSRSPFAEAIMGTLQSILGKDAGLKLMRAERFWESAVGLFKDIIIIRNLFTFVNNTLSNGTILASFGLVNPKEVARLHKEGAVGIIKYQQDVSELNKMVLAKKLGKNVVNIDNRITELMASIETNPVKPLIDAGMQQSIVEDIDKDAGQYIRDSKLGKRIKALGERIPQGIKTFGNEALVMKGSNIHNWLYKGTAMSDFVARYALYKYMSELSGNKNLSSAEALRVADAAFINYDLLSHPNMDKINRLGLMNFTRFTLRIQKTILTIWRNHPVTSLATAVTSALFGVESISESVLPERKLLYKGAFDLPGSVEDIITIKAAGSLL